MFTNLKQFIHLQPTLDVIYQLLASGCSTTALYTHCYLQYVTFALCSCWFLISQFLCIRLLCPLVGWFENTVPFLSFFPHQDSENSVLQKMLWCDTVLCRQSISTLEIHCQLMLVFGDGVLRPHYLGRGYREFKSWLASIMYITPFSPTDKEHVNTAQVAELVLEKQQDTIRGLSIAMEWFVKLYPHCLCTAGIQQCVHGGYEDTWWKFTKIYVWRCSFTSIVI